MKSLILSIGGILLAANIAILMLLTNCTDMVLIVSSSVVLATILLIFVSTILNIKDAFKIFLSLFFVFNGIVEYVLSFFVSTGEALKNDGFLIAIILLVLFQLICLTLINSFSRHG